MNNDLLDSTKKAGMHISNIHICFLMFVELRELLRSGAIRRHQFGSKRAIYSALLAAIFTLLHRFAIVFLVSSLYSNTSSFGYPERGM